MKALFYSAIIILAISLVGCQQGGDSASTTNTSSTPESVESPAPGTTPNSNISGTVVETMNAMGYTYVQVDSGEEQVWAATSQFEVSEGDMVVIPEGMPMHNYHSQTLDREFELVYFVDSILNASTASASTDAPTSPQMPEGHPPTSGAGSPAATEPIEVTKLEDGMTIEEIYADKENLNEKQISLRGQVVKVSPQIMGTNWIHLQDGSGSADADTHDLTVTSDVLPKVGDVVVATGEVTLDKDFGHGYFYNLIMESAAVTVE